MQIVLFKSIQFSMSMQFRFIQPIDWVLSGATILGQSEPGKTGNEGVLCIPQCSSITATSPSNCLVSYCGDLGINSKTPNRILTRRLPDTKCINASPRIRLHASIRLKSEKRKIIKSKGANGKGSRQN